MHFEADIQGVPVKKALTESIASRFAVSIVHVNSSYPVQSVDMSKASIFQLNLNSTCLLGNCEHMAGCKQAEIVGCQSSHISFWPNNMPDCGGSESE